MIELAVASRAETFERMREPLAERDVRARYVRPKGRTFALGDLVDSDGTADGGAAADAPPDEFAGFDVGYVYPSRLMEGGVVDALLDVPWVNGREAVVTSRNKGEVIARLAAAGVPVPETVVVSNPVEEAALVSAFERLGPPVVVKPNSATRGVGVAKVGDVDSLLGVVDYLDAIHGFEPTGDKSFLLQAFVPGAQDYRVMVVDREYAGAVERRHVGERGPATDRWKHNVHRNAEATGVDLPVELRELAERVATVLDVDLLGVDLLVTEDRVVVTETAARPTIDDEAKYEPDFYDRLAALIRKRAEE